MANATQSDLMGAFVWYDQMSNDLPGAEKFYSKVVGWSLEPNTMNSQKYTLLKTDGNMVGGLMPIPEDAAKMGVRPAWMGYIAVNDVKAYADKVKAAGGVIHRPPTEIPNVGTFAVAGDPSGAGFLLFKGDGEAPPKADPMKPGHIGWQSCTAAMIRRRPSPSIQACSAGRRAKRCRWARWGPTRSSTSRVSRPEA